MPLYTYSCETCGRETDAFRSVEDRARPVVCECGHEAAKVPFARGAAHSDLEPYVDEHLCAPGGAGGWVRSKQHRKDLMRQYGLRDKGDYFS